MKWDNAGLVESVIWDMRQADLPRGENRTIIQQLFNGDPPFSVEKAEDNNVEINRNDLEGVDLLSRAREQWNDAMLPPGDFVSVQYDSGPKIKQQEWGQVVTNAVNEVLREHRPYIELQRARGGNAILHGIGPGNWKNRRCPIPNPIPVASLMIPSETEIDFENLDHLAVFREWTPAQLYNLTHGPRCDPGWNMPMVRAQLAYVANKLQKEPNATAYQYMPERIEELIKQDLGFWGSDAVPTIDVWDFYFREQEEGKGWYRRIILDWGLDATASLAYVKAKGNPPKRDWNGQKDLDNKFLYSSGKRKYADSINEIVQCQFADNSCFFPQKYHSIRSLGWMLWGVCDLQNRLHCKFHEQVFLQLMWFFRVASDAEMRRLKSANFMHFGVIPPGVNFIPGEQRFKPDMGLINAAFARNQSLMGKFASAHNQDFERGGETGKEQSATEVMAKVNAVNARVGGMLNLAYTYEEFQDREILRRLCIPNNPYPMAQKFMQRCLDKGVPETMLDVDRMLIRRERVLGAGNQTLQMAIVDGIQKIRKNLGPEAQRKADHLYVLYLSKRKDLADSLAPMDQPKLASESMHDAQLSTERLMMGLPFAESAHMIYEDYVKVWLVDLELLVQQQTQAGMATMDQIRGYSNLAQNIVKFLGMMDQQDDKERISEYKNRLTKAMNLVRGLAQRLKQQMAAQAKNGAGTGGIDAKTKAEIRGQLEIDRSKSLNMRESHAQRTAQRQIAFELEQQRKDRELNADLRRRGVETGHELAFDTLKAFQE